MLLSYWLYGNWVYLVKGESGFYILLFCTQILHARIFLDKRLQCCCDACNLWICGFFYQSTSFFRKIDWSNFQNDVIPNILLETYGRQINTLLRVCACVEMNFLGQFADFILIIFIYLSTVSYQTGTFLEAERFISSSVSKSILLNCVIIWPIWLGISRRFLMLLRM